MKRKPHKSHPKEQARGSPGSVDRRFGVPSLKRGTHRRGPSRKFMSVTASSDVAHTLVILAREPAFESDVLSFFSRKVIRLSWPPSRLEAALLCFQPRTPTCSRFPFPVCRIFAWESVVPDIAFWIASAADARPPARRPGSLRPFFPRFRAPAASISISPSRSIRVGPPRF